jgi:hypothetical protein
MQSIVAWVLATLAIAERLSLMIAPSPQLFIAGSFGWLLFFSFVTWSQLRSLLIQREVTRETISLSISVYLLLGMCWGLLYILIFLSRPQAFSFGGSPELGAVLATHHERAFPIFIYFSLTTLSTIGFGDITPVTLQARYAAVAEGMPAVLPGDSLPPCGMQMSGSGRSGHGSLGHELSAEHRGQRSPSPPERGKTSSRTLASARLVPRLVIEAVEQ